MEEASRGSSSVGRAGVVAAAVLFSTGGAAIKACGLSGWQVASFRSAIAAAVLAAAFPGACRPRSLAEPLVALAYAATMLLFVFANKLTTAANAIFLQSTAPVYVLVMAPLFLREKVRGRDIILLSAMIVGVGACMAGEGRLNATAPDPVLGNALGLGSGVFWAVTVIGLRHLARQDDQGEGPGRNPALTAAVWGNIFAFVGALPLALPAGAATGKDWLVLLYLGLFQIGLAYVCLTAAMKRVRAIDAAILLLLEPVLNPAWAWLVCGERPGAHSLVGGAIILAAAAAAASSRSPS